MGWSVPASFSHSPFHPRATNMKRSRLQVTPAVEESDDEQVMFSDDEYEELKKDAAALAGTRYGGRSEKVLQNNVVCERVASRKFQ